MVVTGPFWLAENPAVSMWTEPILNNLSKGFALLEMFVIGLKGASLRVMVTIPSFEYISGILSSVSEYSMLLK